MPSPGSSEQRRLELEQKKKKLAQMREERKRAEKEKDKVLTGPAPAENGSRQTLTSDDVRAILDEVGISSEPNIATTHAKTNGRTASPREGADSTDESSSTPLLSATRHTTSARVLNLELCESSTISTHPKDTASYNKTTQTDDERFNEFREFSTGSQEFDYDEDMLPMDRHAEYHGFDGSPSEELKELLPFHFGKQNEAAVAQPEKREESVPAKAAPLSDEEKAQILSSLRFHTFFDKATRVVERALAEELDIFKDYSANKATDNEVSGDALVLSRVFRDEKWSAGRCVTGLDFSAEHPELVAVAYDQNPQAPIEPSGVVLVWNTKFKKPSPEYTFQSQTRLTSVAFARFHPNLILAGCYSGQICMWDNRLSKRTPVNKSPLSSSAHTHPVYAMAVVGSHNAHNLVSISTDGRLCSWNVDNLTAPTESPKELTSKQKQIPCLCMAFPPNEVNIFVVGAEDGNVYALSRHGAGATGAGPAEVQFQDAHTAPVSGASFHQASGIIDLSHLFLTASFDWTIKLWSLKDLKPRISFETHAAYVVDVAWSPVHPAVFVSIDAEGNLFLWNINEDIEGPVTRLRVGDGALLRKVQWAESGQQLIVGDEQGSLYLYDVHESLWSIRSEEWTKLTRTLAEISQATEEAEKLSESMRAMGLSGGAGGTSASGSGTNVSPRQQWN